MKAIRMEDVGKISIKDIACPQPAANEVLVKVKASSINPVDVKIGNGMLGFLVQQPFPLTMGSDLAGEVISAGEEVEKFQPGDRVFAMKEIGIDGAFAEYCLVNQFQLAHIPDEISDQDAGAIPMVFLTAYQALIVEGKLRQGQRLLIQQGAGGVGHIAIQIAKSVGAHVTVMTSKKNRGFVTSLGADEVIDYQTQNSVEALLNKPVDLVLESLYGEEQVNAIRVIKCGGKLVSISGLLPETEEAAKKAGVNTAFVFVQGSGEHLLHASELMTSGKLSVHVSKSLRLEDFQLGYAQSSSGKTRGKIAIIL
ncbi:Zinc-type alcohol dehydrogenase-like protein [Grimontia celer]|uniref:Zinc-type alcohol dehydrogenase-like protein n=1 Tax=Grimontia celer TaxID=1796497 RepID=A0A128EUV8_9GAMM|nr:NADP-dependent oxidoreductase [Grimontia celer]CZF77756.1 Zinc-type alcohol dehydrogenase-like protein [Grimontia celer]